MAKVISELSEKTNIVGTDYIPVEDANATYKATVSNLSAKVKSEGKLKNMTADANGKITITQYDDTTLECTPHDSTKQDTLQWDSTPTQGSTKPVTSGGIYTAIGSETTRATTAEGVNAQAAADALAAAQAAGSAAQAAQGDATSALSGLTGKVDKETGKGLSTNDYTSEDKAKVAAIQTVSASSKYAGGTEIGSVTINDVETKFYTPHVSHIYGFHIDGAESVPSAKITYLADAVGMTPAHMDYTNDVFDYGSWENAFFMPRPCMLKSDGTVDYYLDPDDYTKKLDGTASDVANEQYDGNAMMEWGKDGRKIWYKIVPDANDATSASVYIADYQADANFVDYPFHNFQGVSGNHFYTPIYNGSLDANNKLRSISGKQVMASKTATQEVSYAEANNPANTPIWNIEVYADIVLITLLLWLMGKSTDSQTVFGRGVESGSQAACEAYRTGAGNTKGLFYGDDGSSTLVKVFGMENFWALQWRRYVGHLLIDGTQYVKMTYGQEDGSTGNGFNLTGTGYKSKGHTPEGTSGQYMELQEYDADGFYPKKANNTNASASKHYCDYFYFNNSGTRVPLRGGASGTGAYCGVSAVNLASAASNANWHLGAAVSCKPLS